MKEIIVVRTKAQLKKAIKDNVKRIEIRGSLAEKVNTSFKIKKLSKVTLALLIGTLATVPFTGPLGFASASAVAALTGTEIALIIAVSALGLGLVLLIVKEYRKVKFNAKHGNSEAVIELEKN